MGVYVTDIGNARVSKASECSVYAGYSLARRLKAVLREAKDEDVYV